MPDKEKIQGTKIRPEEFVNLLSKWRNAKTKIHIMLDIPEVFGFLRGFIAKVEFPAVTVSLGDDPDIPKIGNFEIVFHLSGCVLERFEVESDESGIGTCIRASWLSLKGREITFAEPLNS